MTTAYAPPDNRIAIQNVTLARCNREHACANIGERGRYMSFDSCTQEIGADVAEKLGPDACAKGIQASELARCLDDIRNECCEMSLETIESLASCRKGTVCR